VRRSASALLVALVAAIAAPVANAADKPLPDPTPLAADGLSRALAAGRLDDATYALERARALFAPASVSARYGPLADVGRHDATMILRDLVLRLDRLAPAQRVEARRILARPRLAHRKCGTRFCVHWTRSGIHRATRAWRDRVLGTFGAVSNQQVERMGFRRPRPDRDRRLDVYVMDIGRPPLNLYGYCVPIAKPRKYPYWDRAAYCVVDNDYRPGQYVTGATGLDALHVTGAHEFFHAVQFAYDFAEDLWMLEGTATWVEDEVYDAVDDNIQYLQAGSPLTRPGVPLDYGGGIGRYGNWIFWRYLSEVRVPDLYPHPWSAVRQTWLRAAGTRGAPDDHSTEAVANALAARGTTLKTVFADFGAHSRHPAVTYAEGVAYPIPPDRTTTTLAAPATVVPQAVEIDHLATRYVAFVPDAGNPAGTTIEVSVHGLQNFGAATLVVESAGGIQYERIAVDGAGDGSATAAFDATVTRAVLVLTNAGRLYRCWTGAPYSCAGTPQRDHEPFVYSATVTP
jgi:hypothetical protein